ncbi:adenylate/guanylate cyclase domain-containing protein [Bacteroidota bacterium]
MNKTYLYKILFLVSFWIVASVFFVLLVWAIESWNADFYAINNYQYELGKILVMVILVTFIGSSIIASLEVLYFNKLLRKKPLGFTILIKTTFYMVNIFFFSSLATIISFSFDLNKPILHTDVLNLFMNYLVSSKVWIMMTYWSIAVMLALFILHISDKFGKGVLFYFLIGKYHNPREELRIFMFLDLKSSTAYAEKLGHIKYSQLLQDCFYELTEVVLKCEAQVYQYVGDEVVLTWTKDKGINDNNCIKIFFDYNQRIRDKGQYYKNKYGIIPEFKAGLNLGYCTVAEVGEIKKELAYHGDALNTASRIRSACNNFKKRLLISADLISLFSNLDEFFTIESMGVVNLEGKKNVVGLFSIEEGLSKNSAPV